MASRVPVYAMSVDEYLEAEKSAPVRHEYVAGQIYAMAGASDAHNTIALNFATLLRSGLRGGPCRAYMSDMKVWIEAAGVFYYPDVLVTLRPDRHRRIRQDETQPDHRSDLAAHDC
jgi:Uma2 family endonuclease